MGSSKAHLKKKFSWLNLKGSLIKTILYMKQNINLDLLLRQQLKINNTTASARFATPPPKVARKAVGKAIHPITNETTSFHQLVNHTLINTLQHTQRTAHQLNRPAIPSFASHGA
ncbi:hypothetical protein OSB04_001504 [Centaurea solstitialis]|uniref:Uncharacterized protein n=1 Tax=Centaurea solstitialis TaxID=347529 RepID=A0AA38UA25_9ASTR|nr:hypothetical protein OSB04_001504 [Centaurea solstitialis]